ncbi:hypothetical protein CUMW_133670 [Citrus unshiu]|nr:hypothetical protein CUMW_133660 [Citrus unshiu]GAY51365.1 hypothetical protein CUMW_133670 [Citrus unshiu]
MIYRKWSLLTGPVTILGGIVGAIVVSTYAFVDSDIIYEKVKGLEPLYQIVNFGLMNRTIIDPMTRSSNRSRRSQMHHQPSRMKRVCGE